MSELVKLKRKPLVKGKLRAERMTAEYERSVKGQKVTEIVYFYQYRVNVYGFDCHSKYWPRLTWPSGDKLLCTSRDLVDSMVGSWLYCGLGTLAHWKTSEKNVNQSVIHTTESDLYKNIKRAAAQVA